MCLSMNKKRICELDGIRGWAAFFVLIFHLCREIFASIIPEFRSFYFYFIFDGLLMVNIFFVLSGDALSNSFITNNVKLSITKLVIKRYLRLAGPIFLSSLIVYLITFNGLNFQDEAARIINNDWLIKFLKSKPNFFEVFKYSLIKVFTGVKYYYALNPFLWPMRIELFGSIAVFFTLTIFKKSKNIYLIVFFFSLILMALGSKYSCFFFGISISILRNKGFFKKNFFNKISFIIIIMGVLLDTFSQSLTKHFPQLTILCSFLIIFGIYNNKTALKFFSNKLSIYLGKISFSLYLIHFSIIISLTSYLIIYFNEKNILNLQTSLLIILISCIFSLIFADLFSRTEEKYLRFLKKIT